MKQNNNKRHIIGLISMALIFSVWGGQVAHSENLLDHVGSAKTIGDRFSILDFNDIWTFVKVMFTDGTGKFGIGAEPSGDLTFDVTGKMGATDLCDEDAANCKDLSDEYAFAAPQGSFVGKTTATTDGITSSNSLAGYAAANDLCNTEFAGTHMCSSTEIVATVSEATIWEVIGTIDTCPTAADYTFYTGTSALGNTNGDSTGDVGEFCVLTGWTGTAWVNAGGSKYANTTVQVDDCGGWTYNGTTTNRGNFWNFDAGTQGTTSPKNGGAGGVTACNLSLPVTCCR